MEDEEKDYDKIREVLTKNNDLSAEQVAEESDVSIECVLRMLDEGLIANIAINQNVKCGMCGAPAISISKRLCQGCLEKLNAQVATTQQRVKLGDRKRVEVGEVMGSVRKTIDNKRR